MTTDKPKRKGLPKTEKKKTTVLFDFLNDITYDKVNILNSENNHAYSKYMITSFLSMHEPYLPIVDIYLNKYQGCLSNADFHKMCLALIPKKKIYLNYVKGKPAIKECKDQLEYIVNYFKISYEEAYDYYLLGGDKIVVDIKRMYGIVE
jgi:hypothetical protein